MIHVCTLVQGVQNRLRDNNERTFLHLSLFLTFELNCMSRIHLKKIESKKK